MDTNLYSNLYSIFRLRAKKRQAQAMLFVGLILFFSACICCFVAFIFSSVNFESFIGKALLQFALSFFCFMSYIELKKNVKKIETKIKNLIHHENANIKKI